MSIVAAIRQMLSAGLSLDQALTAAEIMEAEVAAEPTQSARQARNRRYYEARRERLKATENRLKTSELRASEKCLKASESVLNSDAPRARVRDITSTSEIYSRTAVDASAGAPDQLDDWPQGDALAALVTEVASPRLDPTKSQGLILSAGRIVSWRTAGASWEHDVLPVVRALTAKAKGPVRSWDYFRDAIAQSIADNRQALTIPEARTHDRTGQDPRNTRSARRGVWAEVLAEERGEGVGEHA